MATSALRSLWAEPRPTNAPDRGPRDWALVAALVCWSVVEVVLRQDLAPRPLLLLAVLAVLGPPLWRRTHPLVAVAVSFGTLTVAPRRPMSATSSYDALRQLHKITT